MAGEAGVYDDLDELDGTIAHYANHADSDAEEERWDQLSERVEIFLKLSESMQ